MRRWIAGLAAASTRLSLFLFALAASACGGAAGAEEPLELGEPVHAPAFVQTFRASNDPDPVSGAEVRRTLEVVAERLRRTGHRRFHLSADGRDVRVSLPSDLAPEVSRFRKLVTFRSYVELRVRAPEPTEKEHRAKIHACDPKYTLPVGYRWVSLRGGGRTLSGDNSLFVERPEERLEIEYAVATARGAPAAQVEALRRELADLRSSSVFAGSMLGSAKARKSAAGWVVDFELVPDRTPAFREFAARHVGRTLVVVVGYEVWSILGIEGALDGKLTIDGAGSLSREEAEALAACLSSGDLPLDLEPLEK